MSRNQRATIAAVLVGIASLFATSSAFAIYDHNELQAKFPTGCAANPGAGIDDIAIDEGSQQIYVYCRFSAAPTGGGKIYRLNYNGGPANFTASKPYISGNQLVGNPGAPSGSFAAGFAGGHIAVDNSGGPNDGLVYIVAGSSGVSGGSDDIQIFAPNGEYRGAIVVPLFAGDSRDVFVGPDGSVYFLNETRVSKYSQGYNEVARMYLAESGGVFGQGNRVVADSKGAVWTVASGPLKFEPDQIFTNYPPSLTAERERFTGSPSPFVPRPLLPGENNEGVRLSIDPSGRNDLYVNLGNKIQSFSEGNASDPAYANAPSFGTGANVTLPGIEVTKDHLVFSSAPGLEISRFGPGQILPDVHTDQVAVDQIDHKSAELDGTVELDGGTPVTKCELQIGDSTAYSSPPVPCTPSSFATDSAVEAEPTGLDTGDHLPLPIQSDQRERHQLRGRSHLRPRLCAESEDPRRRRRSPNTKPPCAARSTRTAKRPNTSSNTASTRPTARKPTK